MWHKHWTETIYVGQWPIFHGPVILLYILKTFWWTKVGWLCWGLTSQSTIFQSCRDGAIASWVINQYFRGVKCLAQGHNTAAVGLEPRTSRSGVRHSTTEPPHSPNGQRSSLEYWIHDAKINHIKCIWFSDLLLCSSSFNLYLEDILMEECWTEDIDSVWH